MPFEVIPALDVSGGRLVRITERGPAPVEAFGSDPHAAAEAFVEAGAGRLHVVDVDRARTGEAAHLDLLARIHALGVAVQASGGVTTPAHVAALLGAGADRVVLGSAALASRNVTEDLISELGAALVVGIEARGATIAPRGGGSPMLPLGQTLEWLDGLAVRRYLYTDVRRVGALDGPDLDGIGAIAARSRAPVLAAGGIRDLGDLRAVAALGGAVEGAVVGRALYEGLDVRAALAISD